MKSYKTKFVAPFAIGIATLGFVAANSTPAPAADMAVYGKKSYGTKKKAVYGKKKVYGPKKKAPYGSKK